MQECNAEAIMLRKVQETSMFVWKNVVQNGNTMEIPVIIIIPKAGVLSVMLCNKLMFDFIGKKWKNDRENGLLLHFRYK